MLEAKFADDPSAKFFFYNVIGQSAKVGCPSLTYDLFSQNINS